MIVDTPPGFTPEVIATVDAPRTSSWSGMLDALSLKNSKLGLETLELMGYDRDRVRILLNRADSSVGHLASTTSRRSSAVPDVLVPSDRDIVRSVNEGEPIVVGKPRSEAAKAFRSARGAHRRRARGRAARAAAAAARRKG